MSAGDTCVSQPLLSVPSHQGTGGQGVGTSRNRLSPGAEPRPVSWAQGPPAGTTHLAGQSRLGRTERSGLVQCGRRGSRGWGWALWVGRDLGAWLPGPLPPSGLRELLTHTECSLGVQLKALRAAGILVLCKAKRPPLRSRRSPPGAPARPRLPGPAQAPSSLLLAGGSAPARARPCQGGGKLVPRLGLSEVRAVPSRASAPWGPWGAGRRQGQERALSKQAESRGRRGCACR